MGAPAPRARPLAAWAVVACAAAAAYLVHAGSPATAQPDAAAPADAERGGELYQRWCAVCHATDGTGTGAGPPIDEVSIALADLTMRTGSMPLTDEGRGVRERTFTDEEREATLAYMVERFELSGRVSQPGPGDPARGQDRYTVHCAACHGASGEGGVSGGGATVPRVRGLEPILVAQAVRVGPFQMPPFNADLLPDDELDDIVAFLDYEPPSTLLGLSELTRVGAAWWAALLGTTILAACWWIAHRPVRAPDADLPGEHRPKGTPP